MVFEYGEKETEYLKSKDKRLAEVIGRIGHIDRGTDPDLFTSVVRSIIGQQISTKAQITICGRLDEEIGEVTPESIAAAGAEKLQSLGMTMKKAEYIVEFAEKTLSGEFGIEAVERMSDEEAIRELTKLRGIGVWTAEMMLLFCLQRPDILSYDDLAIQRGMRMVYRHRKIDKKLFAKYKRRLSPCCSVASLYFWAVAGGAIPELTDPAPKKKRR
ncbi:MAG: DNA-3-methyladenine glycosylase 2 family protein [Firmicutes bacterium]|nr:DNA-3-methyladenine glycosylase 2 family protein [Bacillota bacterium]